MVNRFRSPLWASILCSASQGTHGQAPAPSASDLLIHQLKTQERAAPFAVTCGRLTAHWNLQRPTLKTLISHGAEAAQAIQAEIEMISKTKSKSIEPVRYARYLFIAYANVLKRGALPWLMSIRNSMSGSQFQPWLSNAIAQALDLTDYVDELAQPTPDLCRGPEPRDALSGLLFAALSKDRPLLSQFVAPGQSTAFDDRLNISGAIGFRFAVPGNWSLPENTPDEPTIFGPHWITHPTITLPTYLTDQYGRELVKVDIEFVLIGDAQRKRYVVSPRGLENLVRVFR